MKHFRSDYDKHIVDTRPPMRNDRIPDDEPVFLLRAQDKHAVFMLNAYIQRRLTDYVEGSEASEILRDPEMRSLVALRDAMAEWQSEHGSKRPDSPVKA